jgi:hypothetical protein
VVNLSSAQGGQSKAGVVLRVSEVFIQRESRENGVKQDNNHTNQGSGTKVGVTR